MIVLFFAALRPTRNLKVARGLCAHRTLAYPWRHMRSSYKVTMASAGPRIACLQLDGKHGDVPHNTAKVKRLTET